MGPSEESNQRGLVVLAHEHLVSVGGVELDLTAREFEIVSTLAEHPGWVFSPDELAAADDLRDYSPESVSVLVSRLRRKFASAGAPAAIETVRGFGYRLSEPAREPRASSGHDASAEMALLEASWRLQEAVLEVEHSGDDDRRLLAAEALDSARTAIQDSADT